MSLRCRLAPWLPILMIPVVGSCLLAGKKKDKYSVRMGEFLVVATALHTEPTSETANQAAPHSLVVVHVKVTNLGKQFPCSRLDSFLEVRPYYKYRRDFYYDRFPALGEMLPGQTVEGDYAFTVRKGTEPVALILKSTEVEDARCREHPDWGAIWHAREEGRVALDGLPASSE